MANHYYPSTWQSGQETKPNDSSEDLVWEPAMAIYPNPPNRIMNMCSTYVEDQKNTVGLKYDQEKPDMSLLDPEWLSNVAEVLTFGKQKYAAHNWRKGIEVSRLIAASYRHLGAINRGEDIDPESGLPHTAHLSCCVMFLNWILKHKPELDDRWKPT